MPSRELPTSILSSTKLNGCLGSSDTSHSDNLHISIAIGLMSAPYRHWATTLRSASVSCCFGVPMPVPVAAHASTRRAAR